MPHSKETKEFLAKISKGLEKIIIDRFDVDVKFALVIFQADDPEIGLCSSNTDPKITIKALEAGIESIKENNPENIKEIVRKKIISKVSGNA